MCFFNPTAPRPPTLNPGCRPHGFNVDLAHAIIKLTDSFGTFLLDNVATSPSRDRRASTLTLPEVVQACTESLSLLAGSGDSGRSLRPRRIGATSSHRRIAAAAADPASFLEDVVATAARSGGSEPRGGRGAAQREEQLRIKRAVCEATIDILFLWPSFAAADSVGHLLTTRLGCLVVLPSPGATAEKRVPASPPLSRRLSFSPSVVVLDGGASAHHHHHHHLAVSPAARLLDTCPPPAAAAAAAAAAAQREVLGDVGREELALLGR